MYRGACRRLNAPFQSSAAIKFSRMSHFFDAIRDNQGQGTSVCPEDYKSWTRLKYVPGENGKLHAVLPLISFLFVCNGYAASILRMLLNI